MSQQIDVEVALDYETDALRVVQGCVNVDFGLVLLASLEHDEFRAENWDFIAMTRDNSLSLFVRKAGEGGNVHLTATADSDPKIVGALLYILGSLGVILSISFGGEMDCSMEIIGAEELGQLLQQSHHESWSDVDIPQLVVELVNRDVNWPEAEPGLHDTDQPEEEDSYEREGYLLFRLHGWFKDWIDDQDEVLIEL